MTIEEKIKKLNSICDEKILVWTKDKKEALEFCEFINEHYNMRYDLDSVKSSYYYFGIDWIYPVFAVKL